MTTRNSFLSNDLAVDVPWIRYFLNHDVQCLSGNHFVNYAFYAEGTNITSCSRLELLECAFPENLGNNYTVNCSREVYGEMDPVLFDEKGIFEVDQYHYLMWPTFHVVDSNIALDNVEFRV